MYVMLLPCLCYIPYRRVCSQSWRGAWEYTILFPDTQFRVVITWDFMTFLWFHACVSHMFRVAWMIEATSANDLWVRPNVFLFWNGYDAHWLPDGDILSRRKLQHKIYPVVQSPFTSPLSSSDCDPRESQTLQTVWRLLPWVWSPLLVAYQLRRLQQPLHVCPLYVFSGTGQLPVCLGGFLMYVCIHVRAESLNSDA